MTGKWNKTKTKKPLETSLGRAPKDSDKVPDLSHLRKPITTSVFGLKQVLSLFQTATTEVQEYITYECDVLYECRICRTIFRSLANFILHKRNYCREKCTWGCDSNQDGGFVFSGEDVNDDSRCATPVDRAEDEGGNSEPPVVDDRKKVKKDILPIIDRLLKKQKVKILAKETLNEDLSNKADSDDDVIFVSEETNVVLQKIDTSEAAVFQTTIKDGDKMAESDPGFMKSEVMEIHGILENNEAVLGTNGKVCSFETNKVTSKPNIPKQDLICTECNFTFSTEKTLTHHIKYKHNKTCIVFPCPDCKETFSNAWSVYRHLYKVHRRTSSQVRRMRPLIHSSGIRKDQEPEKKKRKVQSESDENEENQWMSNFEGDKDLQMCGGCGKRFERKAALHSHSQMCTKRIAVCNSIKNVKGKAESKKGAKNEQTNEVKVLKGAAKRKPNAMAIHRNVQSDGRSSSLETIVENTSKQEAETSTGKNGEKDASKSPEKSVALSPEKKTETSTSSEMDVENVKSPEKKIESTSSEENVENARNSEKKPETWTSSEKNVENARSSEKKTETRTSSEKNVENTSPEKEIKTSTSSEDSFAKPVRSEKNVAKHTSLEKKSTTAEQNIKHAGLEKKSVITSTSAEKNIDKCSNLEKKNVITIVSPEKILEKYTTIEKKNEENPRPEKKASPEKRSVITIVRPEKILEKYTLEKKNERNPSPETKMEKIIYTKGKSEKILEPIPGPATVLYADLIAPDPEKLAITKFNSDITITKHSDSDTEGTEANQKSVPEIEIFTISDDSNDSEPPEKQEKQSSKRKRESCDFDSPTTEISDEYKIYLTDEADYCFLAKALTFVDKDELKCTPCDSTFLSRYRLLRHMSLHFSWFRFQCSKCSFMSFNKYDCTTHAFGFHNTPSNLMDSTVLPIPKWKVLCTSHEFAKLDAEVASLDTQSDANNMPRLEAVEEKCEAKENGVEAPETIILEDDEMPNICTDNVPFPETVILSDDEVREHVNAVEGSKFAKAGPSKVVSNRPIRNRTKSVKTVQNDFIYDLAKVLKLNDNSIKNKRVKKSLGKL